MSILSKVQILGKTITITHYGKPVAQIVPMPVTIVSDPGVVMAERMSDETRKKDTK